MLASVATANTVRMPMTTYTTTVCTLATACEPSTFREVITHSRSTAKALIQAESLARLPSRRSCQRTLPPSQ